MANPVPVIITKEARQELVDAKRLATELKQELLAVSTQALSTSASISKIKTPGGLNNSVNGNAQSTANVNALTDSIKKQTEAVKQLNLKSSEEIVNSRILRTNSERQVLATSQLAGAYRNLSAEVSKASEKYQNIIVRGRTAEQTQRQYNRELRTAQREFQVLQARVLQADSAVGKWNRTGERSIGFMKNLVGAFGIVGGVTLFASLTRDIYEQTKQMQSLDLALKQVTGTAEEFAKAQIFLNGVAERNGVEINALTKSYTQFYISAKDKLSGSEIEGIFNSISKAAGAMGLSVDQQEGAFLALTQMLSKGTIQAEELRGQLSERLPGAFGILAKSMGVTEQELNKLLKDGKVIASEVLPAFAKELEKAYGIETLNRVESLNASQTRLGNQYKEFIRSLNEGSGAFSRFLQVGINNITNLIALTTNLITSNEKLRKDYLEGQKEQGRLSAIDAISKIKDADEKEEYANNAIIRTRKEIAKNRAEFDRLTLENTKIKDKTTTNSKEVYEDRLILKSNEKRLKVLNNTMASQIGYVSGLTKIIEKEKEKTVVDEKAIKVEKEKEVFQTNSNKAFNETIENLKNQADSIDKTTDAYKFLINTIGLLESIQDNIDKNPIKLPDFVRGNEDFSDPFENIQDDKEVIKQIAKDFEEWNKQLEKTNEYFKGFSDSIFADAGLDSFKTFFDGTFKALYDGAETTKQKFAIAFTAISEAGQEAFNFLSQASQNNFDAEYSRLEKQKDISLRFAGESASAKENIERQYDERRRAIQRREAESNKKLALLNIAINTAQGIVSALAMFPPNIPLSIAIGVIGAVQAGIVASQEIPQFFEGGTHKGGIMMVNDAKGGAYKETVVTPDGKVIKPEGRNVLMNAPMGTQIFRPDQQKELNDLLASKGISLSDGAMRGIAIVNNNSSNNGFSDAGVLKIVNAINSQPRSETNINKKGISQYTYENGIRIQRLNNRLHGKG